MRRGRGASDSDYVVTYVAELRRRGEERRREGSPTAALYDLVANELEARRLAHEAEELSIPDAVDESGYSPVQLRRLVKLGIITLRRGDLPRRPGHRVRRRPTPVGERPSLTDEVLASRARKRRAV